MSGLKQGLENVSILLTLTSLITLTSHEAWAVPPLIDLGQICAKPGDTIPIATTGGPIATSISCDCFADISIQGATYSSPNAGYACFNLSLTIPPGIPPGKYPIDVEYSSGQPQSDCGRVWINVVAAEQEAWTKATSPGSMGSNYKERLVNAVMDFTFDLGKACKAPLCGPVFFLQTVSHWGVQLNGGPDIPLTPSDFGPSWAWRDSLVTADNRSADVFQFSRDPYTNGWRPFPKPYDFGDGLVESQIGMAGASWAEGDEFFSDKLTYRDRPAKGDAVIARAASIHGTAFTAIYSKFETAVLVTGSPFAPKWLGTCTWVWRRPWGGQATIPQNEVVHSMSGPTPQFLAAINKVMPLRFPGIQWPIPKRIASGEGEQLCP